MARENNLILINQAELIDSIASGYKGVYSKDDIYNILQALENQCKNYLLEELDEKHPVIQIKIFAGLSLFGRLEESKDKKVFGMEMNVPKHIKARAELTKSYTRRLNEAAFGMS